MLLQDHLWAPDGVIIIDDRIKRLITCIAVERLKCIGQNGAANYVPDKDTNKVSTITRYEHSVGCMLLTLQIGGTNEEAIVALLHDIMHTAFSHTIDFLANDPSVSYHEKCKKQLLKKFQSIFIKILGLNWRSFFDESRYVLIKKNNPFAIDICDYVARDGMFNGLITVEEVRHQKKYLLIDPTTRQLCCANYEARQWWINTSKMVNERIYNSPWNLYINHRLAEEIRGLIKEEKCTFDEILNPDDDTEKKIVNSTSVNSDKIIRKEILESTKNKNFVLMKPGSYDGSSCTKIGTFPIRKRFVMPPLLESRMDELCALEITNMDLVY